MVIELLDMCEDSTESSIIRWRNESIGKERNDHHACTW